MTDVIDCDVMLSVCLSGILSPAADTNIYMAVT